MILTIEATSARELRSKIVDLAEMFGVHTSQLPLPIAEPVDHEEIMGKVLAENLAEELAPELIKEEKVKKTRKSKEVKAQLGNEPAATLNFVDESPVTQTSPAIEDVVVVEINKQTVADITSDVAGKFNIEEARSLMSTFLSEAGEPCRRISDLKASDYAAYVAKCQSRLAVSA